MERPRNLRNSKRPRLPLESPAESPPQPARPSDQGKGAAQPVGRRLGRKRWLVIGIPIAVVLGLIAIAPPLPSSKQPAGANLNSDPGGRPFRYIPDDQAFALDFDPRLVRIDMLSGWDREQEAFADKSALAYFSGPMYERHVNESGRELTVPLGDVKLGERVWRGDNRSASRQRAFIGVRKNGQVDFSYGELTPERERLYDTFIGGLHSLYNDLQSPPPEYKGAYSIGMGQQIRYLLPRIRMVIGLRSDGRVEVLMSRDGLTLEQTRAMGRERGLIAAYLPDHASKSRFIIPGLKGFSDQDANWISGGATSFVHVPYLMRLSQRQRPLIGSLLSSLMPLRGLRGCLNRLDCGNTLGSQLLDRSLAGFNRLVEQGIEPLARLIWAPRAPKGGALPSQRAPMREPPITADPLAIRDREQTSRPNSDPSSDQELPAPPDLPPPPKVKEGQKLPSDSGGVKPEAAVPPSAEAPQAEANGNGAAEPAANNGPASATPPAQPPPLTPPPPVPQPIPPSP